jgi:hypothetical protein
MGKEEESCVTGVEGCECVVSNDSTMFLSVAFTTILQISITVASFETPIVPLNTICSYVF